MFNSGIKGNQRCNGLYSSPQEISLVDSFVYSNTKHNNINYKVLNKISTNNVHNNKKHVDRKVSKTSSYLNKNLPHNGNHFGSQVTQPMETQDFEEKITVHSIIGYNESETHKPPLVLEQKVKKEPIRATHHETLQRIECERDDINYYQQHWFSVSLEECKLEDRSREERIEITRHDFLRRLQQMQRSNVGKKNKMPDWVDEKLPPIKKKRSLGQALVAPKLCEIKDCGKAALSCAQHCIVHIMEDTRQVLFEYCTAKFADNTQCSVPVFDISHELPLCAEHARKRDNYRLYQEVKPKKIRKKVKPSAMIRPQKRSKKKKKPPTKPIDNVKCAIIREVTIPSRETTHPVELEEDLQIDQVLALNENGLEQALATQAHLLEESDITNVLSTIQVDEFSDFFAVNRNGEYEPSREEAEELEKALAAVDNDVKSLEKLSQTHGLLDSFLDEHVLADSLVQIPEMFHNGYAPCGDNIVAQNSSYLLPIEPHSHS